MVCFDQSILWTVYYSNVHFVIVSIVISAEICESSIVHNEGCPPLIVHFYLWWLWWWLEHIKGNTEVLSHCLGCEYFYSCFYFHWFNIKLNYISFKCTDLEGCRERGPDCPLENLNLLKFQKEALNPPPLHLESKLSLWPLPPENFLDLHALKILSITIKLNHIDIQYLKNNACINSYQCI